ncbi:MAG: molybdopterin oxidoreductase family protein [Halobacteriaceae archaeon]
MTAPEPTVCPRCAVGCSLADDPETGRATGREGPLNPGGRLCPKGIAAFDDVDGDRLETPRIREGGELREATWAEAYERVERAFGRVRERRGPDALAFLGSPHCTNEENYLFQRIARLLGTNNVDNRARICHASAATAMRDRLGSSAMTNSQADLRAADAFLVVGANPAARQPVAFDTRVRPAVNDGATLVHVDPRETETTRLADHHLAARPGTDALLLSAMAAATVEAGLVAESFVAERTEGFDALADHLGRLDVEDTVETCGVDAGAFRDAVAAFAGADRGAAIAGTGIEADDHEGTDAADALLNLLLLTGNLGRRGTGMNLFRGLNNEQGAGDAGCQPARLPGRVPLDDAAARERIESEWGRAPPAEPGLDELALVRAFGDDIGAAWVFGENPAVTRLDDAAVARGMAALDCLVVQDTAPTATVERADVVLPASAWAEKEGTVTTMDRVVQRVRAVRPLPDGVRRDLRILRDLGARLTDRPFEYDGPRAVFEELARVSPIHRELSYPAIEAGGQRWPREGGEGVAVLHRERFAHGGRRAPFVAVPVDATGGEGLVLVTSRRVDQFVGEAGDDRTVQANPEDAAAAGLDDGQQVVVAAEAGAEGRRARGTLSVTTAVRPGTVFAGPAVAEEVAGEGRTAVRLLAAPDDR